MKRFSVVALFPFAALAQGSAPAVPSPSFVQTVLASVDLTTVLKLVVAIVTAVLGYLGAKAQAAKANAESAAAGVSKANLALVRVGAIAVTIAGKAWDRLAPKVQEALADGKITAEERAAIEDEVRKLALECVTADELAKLGEALGLPFAGVIAKIAAFVIERFALAHDDANTTVSAKEYPVAGVVGSTGG